MNALRPTPKATHSLAQASEDFADKLAEAREALTRASREHAHIKQASSLGAEDVVITHLIEKLKLPIPVFVLETGALHSETLALLERLQARAHTKVEVFKPQQEAVLAFVRSPGHASIFESIENRKACCGIRKLEPLGRALEGQRAWVTGLRREQSQARADVAMQENDESQGQPLVKFNPLVDWTWGDVWHYIHSQGVDYNPLHDQFYPSIGCAPCTRAISLGEDFRAGRWWWEEERAKECGLHVK